MRGEMINEYQKLNSEDQKAFRRWLWANAVVGAILLVGLIALAVNVPGDKSETTDQHATIHHNPLGPEMLCAGGSISMSPRPSHWALLTGLAFAVPALGPSIATAQADVSNAANLYPGGHAARCIPAPIFGCVCTIDPSGEAVMFTELGADHHLEAGADSEYLRTISWLRRTCESLAQPAGRSLNPTP